MKVINFEKKKMIPLTNKQQESYEKTKMCNICKTVLYMSALMINIIA